MAPFLLSNWGRLRSSGKEKCPRCSVLVPKASYAPCHLALQDGKVTSHFPLQHAPSNALPTTYCCLWTIAPSKQLNRPGRSLQTQLQLYPCMENRRITYIKTPHITTKNQPQNKQPTRRKLAGTLFGWTFPLVTADSQQTVRTGK